MAAYTDSLRGYGFPKFKRDNFVCVYCDLDGKVWPYYLYLSEDHLLPKDHPLRNDFAYITTACVFCNGLANREQYDVEGKTPDQLIEQKRAVVLQARQKYYDFWKHNVQPKEIVADAGTIGNADRP